jgi:nicotinamide riboside transporter PnuC
MLVVGLIIEMIDVLFVILVGNLMAFRLTLLAFYLTMISYDFWGYWKHGMKAVRGEVKAIDDGA